MCAMTTMPRIPVLDHDRLLASLQHCENLLIIQDLDGVCMELVRDPSARRIDRGYVEATRRLCGHFYVLTNGEHVGPRGVNTIVENAFGSAQRVRDAGLYLPGLGAGGVQFQDCHGRVSHPGVSDREARFLRAVPRKAGRYLTDLLATPPFALQASAIEAVLHSSVLDNPLSPTINLNALHHHFHDRPSCFCLLQERTQAFMQELLVEAERSGLRDAFFVHYAPNLGRDATGVERISLCDEAQVGTTDFQFMLKGAVKEAGVLMILNHYVHARSGTYPLGEDFNVRQAPRGHQALVQLARDRFDPAHMPRIVGVGDTLTSQLRELDGKSRHLRGGSDRGFLQLVQDLGYLFHTDNTVIFVDSSGGEVGRPPVDAGLLAQAGETPAGHVRRNALDGISDAQDPLHLDVIFPGGHAQYRDFFRALAERWSPASSTDGEITDGI